MDYPAFLREIEGFADEKYKNFHKKLLKNDKINVLGVKVPVLRKIAKKYRARTDELLGFPDEFYEVTFIKLCAVSLLGFEDFAERVDSCVKLIDNWAACDCFAPECVSNHREEFLPYVKKYLAADGEFEKRFALTTLLHYYLTEDYLKTVFGLLDECETSAYYVHMAAAWLVAEALAKFYPQTAEYLGKRSLDKKTHNKAIQKACESFRLSEEQKNYLKGIKR